MKSKPGFNLEEIINKCYKTLSEENVKLYNTPTSNEEYTKSLGKYVSGKLGYEFNNEVLKDLNKKAYYSDTKKDVIKYSVKNPLLYVMPSLVGTTTLITSLINSSTPYTPFVLSFLPIITLINFFMFYKSYSEGNFWNQYFNKVYIRAEEGAEKIACASHEFTHYFHYKIDKKLKMGEGVARAVEIDALKDYGFKQEADFISILELIQYYSNEGGEDTKEFRELLNFCKKALKEYNTRCKDYYNTRINKIEESMKYKPGINRKIFFLEDEAEIYYYNYVMVESLKKEGNTIKEVIKN